MDNKPFLKSIPLRENIYKRLVEDIIHGKIGAGERISETSLSQRFSVSKTPVREALIQLQTEGYIVLKKNMGAVVQKISLKKVDELFCIIAVLESYATKTAVAAKKLHKGDLIYLENVIQMMEEYSKEKKFARYRPLNLKFHGLFVERLGNEELKKTIDELRRRMYAFVAGGMTLLLYTDRYIECHKMILEAVKKNDATEASILMENHVMESRQFLIDTLSQT
jgi:DNA-binding GntR family transcriptional regulator